MESGRRVFVVDDEAVVLKSARADAAVEWIHGGSVRDGGGTARTTGVRRHRLRAHRPAHARRERPRIAKRDESPGSHDAHHLPQRPRDVPSTARAMREEAIERALARAGELDEQRRAEHDTEARLARLTKREREVGELVARGLLNKQIAFELGTSEKTVKVHRGRVMRKLRVESVPDLVRLLERRPPSHR